MPFATVKIGTTEGWKENSIFIIFHKTEILQSPYKKNRVVWIHWKSFGKMLSPNEVSFAISEIKILGKCALGTIFLLHTFATPALWAPCDSMYAKYLLKSLNSSIEGLNVMILQLGFGGLSEMTASIVTQFPLKNKTKQQ